MPTTGPDSKQTGAVPEGGEDRISALPEAILEQVPSILPAHEAVRSSALSRRWHVLWKSLPDLRITDAGGWSSAAKFHRLFNHLLLLRPAWSLREVQLCTPPWLHRKMVRTLSDSNAFFLENVGSKGSVRYVEEWIGHAVESTYRGAQQPNPCCSFTCP
jgi:hypothetical protein